MKSVSTDSAITSCPIPDTATTATSPMKVSSAATTLTLQTTWATLPHVLQQWWARNAAVSALHQQQIAHSHRLHFSPSTTPLTTGTKCSHHAHSRQHGNSFVQPMHTLRTTSHGKSKRALLSMQSWATHWKRCALSRFLRSPLFPTPLVRSGVASV